MSTSPLQEIVCCIGQPVAGNPMQYMMGKALAAAGLDWRYLTLEVSPADLGDAVRGMKALGFRGGNFALPHKVAVVEHLDTLSQAAELIGAVNCVHRTADGFQGENTDGKGFVQLLREITDPNGKQVVVLGAGGAARAIAVELGLAGAAQTTIVNRTPERGQELVDLLNSKVQVAAQFALWQDDYEVPADTDILINATPIGLGDPAQRVPLKLESLQPNMIVADVVFNPPQTRLLREAAERGCQTLDGLSMLVNQAVISFKIWIEVDPDSTLMRDAVEEFLGV